MFNINNHIKSKFNVDLPEKHILFFLCENNRIDVLEYLMREFDFDFGNDDSLWKALGTVCKSGNLNAMKLLLLRFGLTKEQFLGEDYSRLTSICSHGHLELLKYIHEKFDLTAEDVEAKCTWYDSDYGYVNWNCEKKYGDPLKYACINGRVDIIKYFFENIGLDKSNITEDVIIFTAKQNELPVIRYLNENFDIQHLFSKIDMEKMVYDIRTGLKVVEYLVENCGYKQRETKFGDSGHYVKKTVTYEICHD